MNRSRALRRFVPLAVGLGAAITSLSGPGTASAGFLGEDGRIAFVGSRDGNDEVYSMKADGSDVRRLTQTPAAEASPAWAPDGSRIAFASRRDGNWEIYVMKSDGTNERRLTVNSAADTEPAWSADGNSVFFTSDRTGEPRVWRLLIPRNATQSITGADTQAPALAFDGFRIAYEAHSANRSAIVVRRFGSEDETTLTQPPAGVLTLNPSWSPSGLRVAYDVGGKIRSVSSAGGDNRPVTDGVDPAWSPSGDLIAFQRSGDIFSIDAGGAGEATNLTSASGLDRQPDWQPLCTVRGTPGNDTLNGTAGRDLMCGLGGNDRLDGRGGNDVIFGGPGNDTLIGGVGIDVVVGEDGGDALSGGAGADYLAALDGVANNDDADGGAGADQCPADAGDDLVNC